MSCYLHGEDLPVNGKVQALIDHYHAHHIHEPHSFEGRPPGYVYLVVEETASFDAARVCLNVEDFRAMKYDGGQRTWLVVKASRIRSLVEMRYLDEPALAVV